MHVSPYTVAAECVQEEAAVLFNGATGTVDVMDRSLWDRLLSRGTDGARPSLVDRLRRRGHLVEDCNTQRAVVRKLAPRFRARDRRTSGFFLIPTYACQLRCSYCCQKARRTAGLDVDRYVMSLKTLDRAMTAMDALAGPNLARPRSLTLYGGEPLQASTCAIVERVVQHASREGYQISVVSNGLEAAAFLPFAGPGKLAGLCLSVHGMLGEIRWRRLAAIARAFLEAGAAVAFRFNVDSRSVEGLEPALRRALKEPWFDSPKTAWNVCPILPDGEPGSDGTLKPEAYVARILRLRRQRAIPPRVECDLGVGRQFVGLLNGRTPSSMHPRHPAFCGSHRGLYVLDPYGLIFGCQDAVRNPSAAIGRYLPSLEIDPHAREREIAATAASADVCERCPYALLCARGCIHRFGASRHGRPPSSCRWMAASVEIALSGIAESGGKAVPQSWL
jgi:uncharacterized protein